MKQNPILSFVRDGGREDVAAVTHSLFVTQVRQGRVVPNAAKSELYYNVGKLAKEFRSSIQNVFVQIGGRIRGSGRGAEAKTASATTKMEKSAWQTRQ